MKHYDIVVVGAGIVGLATALQLLKQKPHLKIAILEKENKVAAHQTGHNSGVIHSGIYYKPGSLKAKNCIVGVSSLIQFCDEQGIAYKRCGKVIIATSPEELPRLDELERRGKANGVAGLAMIDTQQLKEIEPATVGLRALYSPQTAIVDFIQVAQAYARLIISLGGEIYLNQPVIRIKEDVQGMKILETHCGEYIAKLIVNCAGVYADRVAKLADSQVCGKQIIPFRGEYYELVPEKNHLIKGLIYPVPDPKFPFLGVHLSRTMEGKVEAGPNAILALARNGYTKQDINLKDCWDLATYRGFWTMAARYWKVGIYEIYRSFSKRAFLQALQRLVPELQGNDIVPSGAGVRCQVVTVDGKLVDDFSIIQKPGIIDVLNAPSPGATASLSIGNHLAHLALSNASFG